MKITKIFLFTLFAFVFGFYIFPSIVQTPIQATQTNSCSSVVVKVHQSSQAHCPLPGYFRIADIACDGVNFFTRYGPNNKPCMTVAEWGNYAKQICQCVDPVVPTITPTLTEPTPTPTPSVAVGPTCRVLDHLDHWPNTGPDVHRYNTVQECAQRCQIDFPGRNCRSVIGDGQYPENIYCVANICSFDGISIWESGLPRHPSAFTKVRKNNSCHAESYVECMDGFSCVETADGIKVTMVDRSKINPDTQGWPWNIGINCPCQDNIQLAFGGEIFDYNFCELYNHDWLEINDLQNGESYECSFSTLDCKKN